MTYFSCYDIIITKHTLRKNGGENMATTRKKVKVIGTETYIKQDTGELKEMQVIDIEERDVNFHKLWLGHILQSIDLIGNQKTKLAFWILDHLDSNNLLPMTQRQIAQKSGMSIQTVSRTLKALIDSDFLQRKNIGVYQVNPDMLFKGGKTDRMNVLLEYRKEADKGAASINETSATNNNKNVDTPPKNPISINGNNTHTDKQSAQHGTAVPYPANH